MVYDFLLHDMVIVFIKSNDEIRYRILGDYGSPYGKLMTRSIIDFSVATLHYYEDRLPFPRCGSLHKYPLIVLTSTRFLNQSHLKSRNPV